MKRICTYILLFLGGVFLTQAQNIPPWKNGPLKVSDNSRYLIHENGTPFFWLGETGWLMPERLNRDEVNFYLSRCAKAGYNVVQVQTVNAVPAYNVYGQSSHPFGYDFTNIDQSGTYGYWNHMDYIIQTAERNGIYIGMVCIWGGLVKNGLMTKEEAIKYGTFLANRYKDSPNIVWIIGGDIQGNIQTPVWETLARTIRNIDSNHLMTFHPRGRTCSSQFFPTAEWIDFHMFQSGHRRYGQRMGNKDYPIPDNTEEDNWRYVAQSLAVVPLKPVLDGEPSYENIPQGLHHETEPRWQASDVRRYAYWSVFAGACGHTYGCNEIMQFYRPGISPAYFANTPWWEALEFPGFNQMQHLKKLILTFPYEERIPDQTVLIDSLPSIKYDRLIATRGDDYLLVYNYTGRSIQIDLSKIKGAHKKAWWYSPATGEYTYIGEYPDKIATFTPAIHETEKDIVLVVTDASANYIKQSAIKQKQENMNYEE